MTKKKLLPPEWIKPKKYDACEKFTYVQWNVEIMIRRYLLKAIKSESDRKVLFSNDEDFESSLQSIQAPEFSFCSFNSIIEQHRIQMSGYEKDDYLELKRAGLVQKHLWSTSYEDLFARKFISDYSKSVRDEAILKMEDVVVADAIKTQKFRMENGDVENFMTLATLRVDINQNTAVLCKEFKKWLSAAKKNNEIKSIPKDTFDKWYEWKLIGWLDLEIWCALNETNLGEGFPKIEALKCLHKNSGVIDYSNVSDKLTAVTKEIMGEELPTRLNYTAQK